ncbi:GntR family transcriptional regulator [Acuticoccus sp. MNP-M23]|uniref:GntR family transcriptional regulator n=1 Tax=Acuticoccus sp. MNP-M23 TaxID=3072793 RepID=UPI002815B3C4|nr:GntR family transcriptional regulator [Acuticoccus sp. MNP-M23]WMS41590.1 GntR family transcriptional regulator [Acuticoccus sp. MNP-M23]
MLETKARTRAAGDVTRPAEAHGGRGDLVAQAIREGIYRCRYVPGQRLVEADLTAEFGISRSLLREAFRRLAAEGTIEIVPNRGALVRRLTLKDAEELFEIRLELETLAARKAAQNAADPLVRAAFLAAVSFLSDETPRLATAAYIAENQLFHGAMFETAGNAQLVKVNTNLQLSLIMAQISTALTAEVVATSLAEHRVIAQAIEAADAEGAATATRAHLGRARDMVLSMPAAAFTRGLHGDEIFTRAS